MGNTATYVSTGKPTATGAVYVAPIGTALPSTADEDLSVNSAYTCLGYVSEDGLENANDLEVSEIKAWGGSIVYRSLNGLNDTFGLKLIESLNIDVLKAVYGDSNVTVDGSGNVTVDVKAENPQEKVWVFDMALRGGKPKKIVVPDGAITARDAITYNDSDAIAYGITVSAYPDNNGSTHFELLSEGEGPSI